MRLRNKDDRRLRRGLSQSKGTGQHCPSSICSAALHKQPGVHSCCPIRISPRMHIPIPVPESTERRQRAANTGRPQYALQHCHGQWAIQCMHAITHHPFSRHLIAAVSTQAHYPVTLPAVAHQTVSMHATAQHPVYSSLSQPAYPNLCSYLYFHPPKPYPMQSTMLFNEMASHQAACAKYCL